MTQYEHAAAMQTLNHEATMRSLVDRALVGAPKADTYENLRDVDPVFAHRIGKGFLDFGELDIVMVAPLETSFVAGRDTTLPVHGRSSFDHANIHETGNR